MLFCAGVLPPTRLRALAPHAFGGAALLACLVLGWGVSDARTRIPNYADVLEALWGIDLYYTALVQQAQIPIWDPNLWNPAGLWVGSLGMSPAVFLACVPIRALTGSATLTYNIVTLASLAAGWVAAYKLARSVVSPWPAYLAALLYTIAPFHWERVNGHINVNIGLAILPWVMLAALRWAQAMDKRQAATAARRLGLALGVLITFQLYGVWWGTLLGVCAAVVAIRRPWRWTLLLAPAIGLALAAPALAWFYLSGRAMDLVGEGVPALAGWGASLNSLYIPSIVHPIEPVRQFARGIFFGNGNESGSSNWGILLPLCAIGGWALLRCGPEAARQAARFAGLCALLGTLLALGIAVKWQGDFVQTDLFQPINSVLWAAGRALKPGLFDASLPPGGLDRIIPLPSYLALVTVPFWESARVATRFMFVAGLGLALLAAVLVERLPRAAGLALAALLIIEALPARTQDLPVPTQVNPAYAWAAGQRNDGSWNILDITDEPKIVALIVGPDIAFARPLHGVPLASGLDSFLPRRLRDLSVRMSDAPGWTRDPGVIRTLQDQRTRFIFVHVLFRWDTRVWDGLRSSPLYLDRGCFNGAPNQVFPEQICVAEVKAPP